MKGGRHTVKREMLSQEQIWKSEGAQEVRFQDHLQEGRGKKLGTPLQQRPSHFSFMPFD